MNLRQQGIQAQELFDQARQNHDNAVAAYDSANQGVAQAQALLQQAQNDLDHTTILSPMNGRAVQVNAHEGEVVIPGTMNNPGSVIAVIADLSEILVEADVGETEITGIRLNESSKVHVDAIPDKEYNGHVAEIGSSAALKQGTGAGMRYFKVKVQFDDADERLRPGMTAQVSIITTTSGSALSVPIQSVVERVPPALAKSKTGTDDEDENAPKSKYVFIVKDGKVKMTEVKTGVSDTTHVALVSGVTKNDQVVTGPFRTLKKLKDGDSVEVTKEESKTPQNGTASK
jgi:HlyD family secretion protein